MGPKGNVGVERTRPTSTTFTESPVASLQDRHVGILHSQRSVESVSALASEKTI